MKYFFNYVLIPALLLPFFSTPVLVYAQTPNPPQNRAANGELIPCGNDYNGDHVVSNYVFKDGQKTTQLTATPEECGFNGLILLIKNAINWLIKISTLIATGVFAYAGIKLLTSQGDPGAMKKSKDMLFNVLKGYIAILLAWVLVYTILNAIAKPDPQFDFINSAHS